MMKIVPVTLLLALAGAVSFADDAGSARQALDAAGIRKGLCIVLGAGRAESPGFVAEVAAGSGFLVHGVALDAAALDRARKAVESKGMCGRATVEKLPLTPLPYLNDLANLVIIEDMPALAKQGLALDEVLRVTAPDGVVCTFEKGKWKKTLKPRPKEMDDWPQPQHGPDGNLVSTDSVLKYPFGYRWLDGLCGNANGGGGSAAVRAWVVAKGRCYFVGINEPENIGAPKKGGDRPRFDLWLSAHDAFNGLPLWKMNLGVPDDGLELGWMAFGPLVADDDLVCAVKDDKVIVVDGATGRVLRTLATAYPPGQLLLSDGILVAACWQVRDRPGFGTWRPSTNVGSIEAYDVATGKPRWSVPMAASRMLAADGVLTAVGIPPQEASGRGLIAVDLKTGVIKWRLTSAKLNDDPSVDLRVAGKGFVTVTLPKERSALVLSAKDGSILWKPKWASGYAPVVDGLFWQNRQKLDPLTGQARGASPFNYVAPYCCQASVISVHCLATPFWQSYAPLPDDGSAAKSFQYYGLRGACGEGAVIADGLMYVAQHNCRCIPGAIGGFAACGPSGGSPTSEDFEKARPVEKGPAFGPLDTQASDPGDWPTWRHDAQRSAATSATLPENLKQVWRSQVVQLADGPLTAAWKPQLTSSLSAPVVAGGKVFVAGTDEGRVVALDVAAGTKLWSVPLGSRIDTPPTIFRGLCIVGCHDGWVYALRAKDGQLAWRARIAPWERRMVAFGAVESVWPVVGSVLVHDNRIYAVAGRTSESEGGVAIVALDPATGAQVWAQNIGAGAQRLTDALALCDGLIGWRYVRLDPATGKPVGPVTVNLKEYGGGANGYAGAMIDGTWTWGIGRRSGGAFTQGKTKANIMAWNDTVAVVSGLAFQKESGAKVWGMGVNRATQVESIALAANIVIEAGRVKNAAAGSPGFLWTLKTADGDKTGSFPLDAMPTHDGLAIAGGRVYLSLQDGSVLCFGKGD